MTSPGVNEEQKPFQNIKSDHKGITAQKRCVFCAGEHTSETCKMNKKSHNEKIDCLKAQGICFGCLTKGHLSKDCQKIMKCEVCSMKHPTILHIYKKRIEQKDNSDKYTQAASVSSTLVSLNGRNHTGAGGQQTLPIIPVQIKLSNSNQTVQTYAFMDQGSTASFCTEALQQDLHAKAKRTKILLKTMGQEKMIDTSFVKGLEVSCIEGNDFYQLPKVYTQEEIPAGKEHIPTQETINKWKYLREIKLPELDCEIGLLIGTNAPKLMEPWKIINSQNGGPFAVKTVLGWVVNGLNQETTESENTSCAVVNRISVTDLGELLVK